MVSLTGKVKNEVFYLSQDKYSAYLERFHQSQHYDMLLVVGEDCIPVNKTQLAVNSLYFKHLLQEVKEDTLELSSYSPYGDARVLQVLMNYLQ